MTPRTIPILILAALALLGCGDDPKPSRPGGGERDRGAAPENRVPATAPPRLDALRHGRGWRITLSPPDRLPEDFEPVLALIEDGAGRELARDDRVEGPLDFTIEARGRVRGVLVDARGRRLEAELELP